MSKKEDFIPEFVYVDDEKLPTVVVPEGKDMPSRLFVYVNFPTGEYDLAPDGVTEVPICDRDIYQYISYNHLKDKVDAEVLDIIRTAMGMEPYKKAAKAGLELMKKVKSNIKKIS